MTVRPNAADRQAVEALLDLAEEALEAGDATQALHLCGQVLQWAPDHAGAIFVSAEAHRDLGANEEAEERYQEVTRQRPNYAPAWAGLASTRFDRLQFELARVAALRAIRLDPRLGDAYYLRAMIRERRLDLDGADRDFLRAWRLDPMSWPRPMPLTDAMIESLVHEATQPLHPAIRSYLTQVPILVEDVPSAEICLQFDPIAPPGELLGLFNGHSLTDRSDEDPWSAMPATIVLYRRNLQRFAWHRETLLEQLRITVLHEVGHFLGLNEDEVEARGLG
ncbi:MAG: metallopeptidase family protein [Myxococcota bacterium]